MPSSDAQIGRRRRAGPPIVAACLLAAALQTLWAGYRFGVGNQSIQLPFLMHLREPTLFANDDLIATLPAYPGLFFPVLARLIPVGFSIEAAYRLLHFATAFLTLLGGAELAAGIAGRRRAGWILPVLLVAGHHRGLSESGLYALGFTHTGVGVALGLLALALAIRGRPVAAFIVAGALMHLHALHGVFIGAMLGAWSLAALPRVGWRRMAAAWALGGAIAAPALIALWPGAVAFDDAWIRLLRIRSAHHVFPSTWWRTGDPQIPRLAALAGLAALAWAWHPPPRRREALALVGVPAALMIAGFAGAEIRPSPFVLRLQLFRSSVFLVALLLAIIAGGLAAASRLALRAWRRGGARARAAAVAAFVGAGFVFSCVALPAWAGLGLAALIAAALLLLWLGRLPWWAAACAGGVFMLASVAAVRLDVPLAALPRGLFANAAGEPAPAALPAAALAAALMALLCRAGRNGAARAVGALVAVYLFLEGWFAPAGAPDPWIGIQRLAEQHTPVEARILTPTVPGAFRIHSRRAVVAEWRDGTQQFFDPGFAERWWARMERIRGGASAESGASDLADLPEEEILAIAAEMGAEYVVLPVARAARLATVARNDRWVLHRAEPLPPPPAPEGFASAAVWAEQQAFLRETIEPNIERYRKSDAILRVRDASGRPLADAAYRIEQTGHRFGFGASLPHFVEPAGYSSGFRPPRVDPRQLSLFLDVFNYSVISFSGKWDSIEPVRGRPDYRALDAYIEWCRRNGVAVEYHFVTGYPPAWFSKLPPEEQRAELRRHANALMDRYGDRIAAWQIVNERVGLVHAPELFRLFRERLPGVPVGVSHCARWHSERSDAARRAELLVGLNDIAWLRSQGAPPDYFGFHGHRPFRLWADLRVVYDTFDAFSREGVRIRLTEFGVSPNGAIEGTVRRGQWTPELHAEYYRLIYLAAFSHPAVDAVNLWGIEPRTWMPGAGLLDEHYRPKPVYEALRRLIREELMTRREGRLPLDGTIRFRGFHGPYRIEIAVPGGPTAGAFELVPGERGEWLVECAPPSERLRIEPISRP